MKFKCKIGTKFILMEEEISFYGFKGKIFNLNKNLKKTKRQDYNFVKGDIFEAVSDVYEEHFVDMYSAKLNETMPYMTTNNNIKFELVSIDAAKIYRDILNET